MSEPEATNDRCELAGTTYCDGDELRRIRLPNRPDHFGEVPQRSIEPWVWYFAGWEPEYTWDEWRIIRRNAPERVPVLADPAVSHDGQEYYVNSHPDVLAWHVRWMRESGVGAILFEFAASHDDSGAWKGLFFSNRTLELAFLGKAEIGGPPVDGGPYADLMPFAVMWTNFVGGPGMGTQFASPEIADYLVSQYLVQPHYARIDGKPVLFAWSVDVLVEVTGSIEASRAYLETIREAARTHGVGEIMIIFVHDEVDPDTLVALGADGLTAYVRYRLGDYEMTTRTSAEGKEIEESIEDYETHVRPGYRKMWEELAPACAERGLTYLVPVAPSQDWRPIDREWKSVVWEGASPGGFEAMLGDARDAITRHDLRPIVIIEAWNEWGEGSYIEPSTEHGFAWLNALRRAIK